MSTNRLYVKDEGRSFRSYWGDVTEKVRDIIGPKIKKAYMKVLECDPKDEPDARRSAKEEFGRYLDKSKDATFLNCDAATVVVTLEDGHTFGFVNSEWGYLEKTDPPEFE